MDNKQMYLRKVLVYMRMLDHAAQELNKAWAEDTDHGVDLNDYLTSMFPFSESFDQVALDIREWVRDFSKVALDEEFQYSQELDVVKHLRARHAEAATKSRFYVLQVWGDVEPKLIGPFDTQAERDAKALEIRYKEGNEDGLYKVWWKGHTHLQIHPFSGKELDEEAMDSEGDPLNMVNHYTCGCGCTWIDRWSCACNDRCPNCNAEVEPDESHEADLP
jgi:hypothetical protein